MNNIYRTRNALLLLVILLASGGCMKRELEDAPTEGNVLIAFDWKNLMSGESVPEGMKLYFYGSDGVVTMKDGTGATGFSGTLPNGTYQVLAYNTDGIGVDYEGLDQYSTASAVGLVQSASESPVKETVKSASRVPTTKAGPYLSQTSHVYAVGAGIITVSGLNNQINSFTATPLKLDRKIDVVIKVTGQADAGTTCTGTISGIAQKVNLTTGSIDGTTAGEVSFVPTAVAGGYEAVVSFFGRVPDSKNIMNIMCKFPNGGIQSFPIDITSALSTLSGTTVSMQLNIVIAITETIQGIYQATLKDWSVEYKNIDAQ